MKYNPSHQHANGSSGWMPSATCIRKTHLWCAIGRSGTSKIVHGDMWPFIYSYREAQRKHLHTRLKLFVRLRYGWVSFTNWCNPLHGPRSDVGVPPDHRATATQQSTKMYLDRFALGECRNNLIDHSNAISDTSV